MSPRTQKTALTRREFGALTAGSLVAAAAAPTPSTQVPSTTAGPGSVLDIADWSYYWYGVERVKLARGTMVSGTQMFVEHWIPTVVRHPFRRAGPWRLRSGV